MARGAAVAATLATARGPLPARGVAATAAVISPGGVAWDDDGTIVFVGPADDLPWEPVSLGSVDEGTIVPGFVDCHVHLPFIGGARTSSRPASPASRTGTSTARRAGSSARRRMLAEAADDEVLAFSGALAVEMAEHGTTATGAEERVRPLRRGRAPAAAARAPARRGGAANVHGDAARVPRGPRRYRRERTGSRSRATSSSPPRPPKDSPTPSTSTSRTSRSPWTTSSGSAAAASAAGLPLRVHADQLGPSGAAEAAAALGARSADHLNHAERCRHRGARRGANGGRPAPAPPRSRSGRRRRPSLRSATPAPPSRSRPT